jgi:hypothetical protein
MSVSVHIFCGGCGTEVKEKKLCAHCDMKQGEEHDTEEFLPFIEEIESYVGMDLKTLDGWQLQAALYEVDEDRKTHNRRMRNREWTAEEKHLLEAMNKWAQQIMDELLSRRGK